MCVHNSCLEPRSISDLKKLRFRIPSYQRGYRWEKLQVQQLLDDIAESDETLPYYLQPIVVAPASTEELDKLPEDEMFDYDLIDGQQRITTILLILKALCKFKTDSNLPDEEINKFSREEQISIDNRSGAIGDSDTMPEFEIMYATRKSSRQFLCDIATIDAGTPDAKRITESPDHVYLWHSYQTVLRWLKKAGPTKIEILAKAIKSRVRVIWYELPITVPDWKKFTDLNIGKIPLTNSELVKALFLRSSNFSKEKESEEYEKQIFVEQWDQMERELSDVDFWGFLTTKSPQNYHTKIDLILNLVSNKAGKQSRDALYTFNYFVEWFKEHPEITGHEKWNQIFLQYQRLRDWYADRQIYHRLGYLISSDFPTNTLARIFQFAHPEGKKARSTERINQMLNRLIRYSLRIPSGGKFKNVSNFRDLKYNCADDPNNIDTSHHGMIKRYLTLYNIMVTEAAGKSLRYSFAHHNMIEGGWSLEHIHAQKSETLNKGWQWIQWVKAHLESLKRISKSNEATPQNDDTEDLVSRKNNLRAEMSNLQVKMEQFNESNTRQDFVEITESFRNIMENLPGTEGLYKDEMANMALLGKYENSTLNNSTFDVKRQKIICMLSANFVPIATERVFLKAIVSEKNAKLPYACDTDHLFFWGKDDRDAYIADMEVKLKEYLSK